MDEMTPEEIIRCFSWLRSYKGMTIIDTGCTTPVTGEATAEQLEKRFHDVGFPLPQQVQLPAVEHQGFQWEDRNKYNWFEVASFFWEVTG